jgi:hypothetical protein
MSRLLYPKGPFLVLFTILLLSQGQIGFAQDEEELSGDSEPVEDATLDDSNAPEPAEEVVDDAPMDEAPMDEAPVDEAPVDEAPMDEAPMDEAPMDEAPMDEAPMDEAPAQEAQPEEAFSDEVQSGQIPVLEPDSKPAPGTDGVVEGPAEEVDMPLESVTDPEAPGESSEAAGADPEASSQSDVAAASDDGAEAETAASLAAEADDKKFSRIFGHKRVRLTFGRPKFDDGQEFYDDLYGNPKILPEIQGDWFAWDWYVTMGVSVSIGLYQADGHPAKGSSVSGDEVEKDENGSTTLTFIPLQYAFIMQGTPLPWKWVVFDAWIGQEMTFWQEVRHDDSAAAMLTLQETSSDEGNLTNKGKTKDATVVGGAVNLMLNGLDEQSAASMRGSMGLGAVYLTGFVEIVRTRSSGVSFGRTTAGIGFTFESVN